MIVVPRIYDELEATYSRWQGFKAVLNVVSKINSTVFLFKCQIWFHGVSFCLHKAIELSVNQTYFFSIKKHLEIALNMCQLNKSSK